MVKEGLVKEFGWTDYINMRKVSIEAALKKIIEVMNGIDIKTLKTITEKITESKDEYIELEGVRIITPKPNPIMLSIITFLKANGIDVYVVTASNKISADIVCWKFFGIPSSNVFGSEINTKHGKINFNSKKMIPFADGKVKTLVNNFKGKPLVTGGDGMWDKYLLDYTNKQGIKLWLGKDEAEYQTLKKSYYGDSIIFQISAE